MERRYPREVPCLQEGLTVHTSCSHPNYYIKHTNVYNIHMKKWKREEKKRRAKSFKGDPAGANPVVAVTYKVTMVS